MFNMVIGGVGGQGTILASHIFADAAIRASVAEGKDDVNVRLGETFGAAMRGGAVASHVKVGAGVYNPLVPDNKADVILGLEPLETLRVGLKYIAPGGTVILNTKRYEPVDVKTGQVKYTDLQDMVDIFKKLEAKLLVFDATELAIEVGNARTMNIVMLGALSGCGSSPVAEKYLIEAIKDRVPAKTIDLNLKAFAAGVEVGKKGCEV